MAEVISKYLAALLNIQTLRALVDEGGHYIGDRRARQPMEEWVGQYYIEHEILLELLSRDELSELSAMFNLKTSGKKDVLKQRLNSYLKTSEGFNELSSLFVEPLSRDDSISTRDIPKHILSVKSSEAEGSSTDIARDSIPKNNIMEAVTSDYVEVFRIYCDERMADSDLETTKPNNGFCPACNNSHIRSWIFDKKNRLSFYLCVDGLAVSAITSEQTDPALKLLSLDEFMTKYPSVPSSEKPSWLQRRFPVLHGLLPVGVERVAQACEIKVNLLSFPPSITVRLRSK